MSFTLTGEHLPFLLLGFAVGMIAGVVVVVRRLRVEGGGPRLVGYLWRYAAALEYHGMRRPEIEDHVDGLRADLGEAIADGATVHDIEERFGPPRRLAVHVTEGLQRPSWMRGGFAALAALVVAMVMHAIVAEAFIAGFEATASPGDAAEWSGLGFFAEATMGDDGRASSIGMGGWAMLVAPVLGFVLGSRIWRLRRAAVRAAAVL